jgi:hypothetical protein
MLKGGERGNEGWDKAGSGMVTAFVRGDVAGGEGGARTPARKRPVRVGQGHCCPRHPPPAR